MAAQDPFYLVRDEIQDLVNKLQDGYSAFERLAMTDPQKETLSKSLLEESRSAELELDELSRAVHVAARDPARFNISPAEVETRKSWVDSTRAQIRLVTQALEEAAQARSAMQKELARRELLRSQASESSSSGSGGNAGAGRGGAGGEGGRAEQTDSMRRTTSDDDQQALLIKEQDEQLDLMSKSLAKIGGMGMAIHEELGEQDKLISELGAGMDSTFGRLELIQKRMAAVMKKMSWKSQLMMMLLLLLLFVVLVILLVYT